MNRIQKAATFVIALTITLLGATLATAPLALASMQSVFNVPGVIGLTSAISPAAAAG